MQRHDDDSREQAGPRGAGDSLRSHTRLGGWGALGFAVIVGAWIGLSTFSGAVVVAGTIGVESNVKKVQHPVGGVVSEIKAHNGDRVRAGDLLVKLDAEQLKINRSIINSGINELLAREARALAERDNRDEIVFPGALVFARDDPAVEQIVERERTHFKVRAAARHGMKSQLQERIKQLQNEIRGLMLQSEARGNEITLIKKELEGVRELWSKNLVPLARVNALDREAARLEGERGQMIASTSQARGKIAEIELQILQIDQDLRTEVSRELAETRPKLNEMMEKKLGIEYQLQRLEIRAPQDGIVHQSIVNTIGGVISPAETLMQIVPEKDKLVVDVKIAPQDIDRIREGQDVWLQFVTMERNATPELGGKLKMVAADTTRDDRTGLSYYAGRVEFGEADELKGIVPGMPVEAFIRTGERTVFSYLVKPVRDQLSKAWRE